MSATIETPAEQVSGNAVLDEQALNDAAEAIINAGHGAGAREQAWHAIRAYLASARTSTAPVAAWQWRMRVREAINGPWGQWSNWRSGHHNSTPNDLAEFEERPLFASPPPPQPGVPRIKPDILLSLREWAAFEQDGGNVEQGAAIDMMLDWYERWLASP